MNDAKILELWIGSPTGEDFSEYTLAFARAIANATKEEDAKVCEEYPHWGTLSAGNSVAAAIRGSKT